VPPEVELALPLPPDCTPLEGCRPLFDELLLDELFDELDEPLDPVELDPELELDPVDDPELDDDLVPVLVVDVWCDPGSVTATTPATATLARDTVVVVAFSRLRPRSRSATACATLRAADWFACPADCSSRLFTLSSVTRAAAKAFVDLSADVLNVRRRRSALQLVSWESVSGLTVKTPGKRPKSAS
jgi:hypothetical protein